MKQQAFLKFLLDKSLEVRDESFLMPNFPNVEVNLSVRRFDKIHPEISGNKAFKLFGWLQDVDLTKPLLSFGGAYSNHLLALSAFAKEIDKKSIGIVRGEEPANKNLQLLQMMSNGMEIHHVSRDVYKQKTSQAFIASLKSKFGDVVIIPEGGAGIKGAEGAQLMIRDHETYNFIIIPAGTGTTALGISMKLKNTSTKVICFQVLKGKHIIANEIKHHTGIDILDFPNLEVNSDFHFGGYAKSDKTLEDFNNSFFNLNQWKPDLVYGAKALYALQELLKSEAIPSASKILYIYTGGVFI